MKEGRGKKKKTRLNSPSRTASAERANKQGFVAREGLAMVAGLPLDLMGLPGEAPGEPFPPLHPPFPRVPLPTTKYRASFCSVVGGHLTLCKVLVGML